MQDWKKTQGIIFGDIGHERNEQSEKDTIKAVIEAIKQNAGPDPQEQVQALENALYGMADGFFQEREKRREAEAGITVIQEILKKAWAEYNSPEHTRTEQRAKAFINCLGLTDGKRKEKTNKRNLFYEYMELIMGGGDIETCKKRTPLDRWEALKVLTERHNLASPESCLRQIRGYTTEIKKKNSNFSITGGDGGILPKSWPS